MAKRSPKDGRPPGPAWTPRQRMFVEAMTRPDVATPTEAALIAGYSQNYASDCAWRLMNTPHIKAALGERYDELAAKTGYDVAKCMTELDDVIKFAKKNNNAMAYAKAVELKAKLNGHLIERRDTRNLHAIRVELVQFTAPTRERGEP